MMEMFVFFKKKKRRDTANRVLIPLQSNLITTPFDFTTSDVTRVVTSKP